MIYFIATPQNAGRHVVLPEAVMLAEVFTYVQRTMKKYD